MEASDECQYWAVVRRKELAADLAAFSEDPVTKRLFSFQSDTRTRTSWALERKCQRMVAIVKSDCDLNMKWIRRCLKILTKIEELMIIMITRRLGEKMRMDYERGVQRWDGSSYD
jgi:hypothetical protein